MFIRRAGVAEQEQVQYLNIDQPVTAICHHEKHPTVVALGTASHLLIYDVVDNKIITSREVNYCATRLLPQNSKHNFFLEKK